MKKALIITGVIVFCIAASNVQAQTGQKKQTRPETVNNKTQTKSLPKSTPASRPRSKSGGYQGNAY